MRKISKGLDVKNIRAILASFLLNRLDSSTDTLLGSYRGNSYENILLALENFDVEMWRIAFFSLIFLQSDNYSTRAIVCNPLFTGIIFLKYWKLNRYFWWWMIFCIIICDKITKDIISNYYNIIMVYNIHILYIYIISKFYFL